MCLRVPLSGDKLMCHDLETNSCAMWHRRVSIGRAKPMSNGFRLAAASSSVPTEACAVESASPPGPVNNLACLPCCSSPFCSVSLSLSLFLSLPWGAHESRSNTRHRYHTGGAFVRYSLLGGVLLEACAHECDLRCDSVPFCEASPDI